MTDRSGSNPSDYPRGSEPKPKKRRRRLAQAIIASDRLHTRVLDRIRDRWKSAPVAPHKLKPFLDLAADVEKQHRDDPSFDPDRIWRELEESIHRGFFDWEHRLFLLSGRKRRLDSSLMRETIGWSSDNAHLRKAFLRECWATVATQAEWARHQRYETPIAWQKALAWNETPSSRRGPGRPPKKQACLDEFQRREQLGIAFASHADEAKHLEAWAIEKLPEGKRPDVETIRKSIGQLRAKK